jgi:Cu(I)/Ag(I) efflux system membrane fusion protein
LDIFPEQENLISRGDAVKVMPETAPHHNFRGKIDYIEPIFRPGSKTLTARVYFNNSTTQLPIGSRVTATIFSMYKNASWLPIEAVFSLGRDKIVFRKEVGGFRAHKVTTGIELNRQVEIVIGLSDKDSVASNVQFLVDNEAFIKTGGR